MSQGGRSSRPGPPPADRAPAATDARPARFEGVAEERRHAARQIQRSLKAWRAASGAPAGGRAAIPAGGGSALPGAVRARMEPKLGADLSGVRVHTSGDSARAAHDLGARAFTVGSDIHFNAGEFSPGSQQGDKLIAHELTHVVQGQKAGVQRKEDDAAAATGDGPEVSDPDEPAEKEADAVAEQVTAGEDAKPAEIQTGAQPVSRKIYRASSGGDIAAAQDFFQRRIQSTLKMRLQEEFKKIQDALPPKLSEKDFLNQIDAKFQPFVDDVIDKETRVLKMGKASEVPALKDLTPDQMRGLVPFVTQKIRDLSQDVAGISSEGKMGQKGWPGYFGGKVK
jgi:hypothetical protein